MRRRTTSGSFVEVKPKYVMPSYYTKAAPIAYAAPVTSYYPAPV